MKDRVPFAKLRTAGFVCIVVACPLLAVVNHADTLIPERVADDLTDVLICFILFCSVMCRLIFKLANRLTLRDWTWRLERVENRVMGYEAIAPFFGDATQSRSGRRLAAVPDDDGPASCESSRAARP